MSFRSFHRVVSSRCAWTLALSLPIAATVAVAQPQTITVTATRVPVRVSDVVAEVTVLDRAAIERSEGRTLVDLLSQQAGLQSTSTGGLGKNSGLFIRGLESRHTLLLVDGVRVHSATVGSPSLDNLPLEGVERIEIVRGPLSSLYGSGAFGGVVQVFTRRGGDGLSTNAKASAGSHGYGQLSAGVGFGDGRFDAAVQLQHTRTSGISATNPHVPFGSHDPDADGFRQNAGTLRLGWRLSPGWRVDALALQSTGKSDLDDGPGSAQAELENRIGSVSLSGSVAPGWRARLFVSDATDSYETLSSASAFATLGVISTRQRQYGWENSFDTVAGTLLTLAERIEEKVSRPQQPFQVDQRHIDALAVGLSGAAGAHVWQASLRHDRNSQFGSQNNGALGYGFAVTPAWRIGASVGASYVAPSFNQLYFPNFGNPLLVPEEGEHAELSLRWTSAVHSLRAAYYEHRYRGFITSGPQPVNLPQARIDGVSVSYEGRWRTLELTASLDHTDPRNATAGHANHSRLLPRRAQRAARVGADWDSGAFSVGATLAAFSHRFDNPANSTRLAGYGTLDLRAEWTLAPAWRLAVKLNNAADKRYETALGYNQPRREAFVTLRYASK